MSTWAVELEPKYLELLHQLVPAANIVAGLVNPTSHFAEVQSRNLQAAARILGLQLHVVHATNARDLDKVFATLIQLRAGGLIITADSLFTAHSEQLAALCVRHAMPAIYSVVSSRRSVV